MSFLIFKKILILRYIFTYIHNKPWLFIKTIIMILFKHLRTSCMQRQYERKVYKQTFHFSSHIVLYLNGDLLYLRSWKLINKLIESYAKDKRAINININPKRYSYTDMGHGNIDMWFLWHWSSHISMLILRTTYVVPIGYVNLHRTRINQGYYN